LGYEKPVSTDAKAKILIGSFLPFSTASVIRVISGVGSDFRFSPNSDRIPAWRQPSLWPDLPIGA
jgi:hypothetical protein